MFGAKEPTNKLKAYIQLELASFQLVKEPFL